MFTITEQVTPSLVDKCRRLKLLAAFQMMNDCDELWTDSEPYAKQCFEQEQRAQLLASRQVEVLRVPTLGERLSISTSIYECKELFGFRNDVIRDEAGEPCYVSYSMGAFIDKNTAKLKKLPQEVLDRMTYDAKYPMDYKERRIHLPQGEPMIGDPVRVMRNDIDYNLHMNNCQYIRVALELLPADYQPGSIRVEYKIAAREGEWLTPRVFCVEDTYVIELACERGVCALIEFAHPQ